MKKSTKHWIESAESDIAIIERIIDAPELTHQTSFHAQQAIEKTFKAIIEEHGYIDARYPGAMGLLPDGKPSLNEATLFYNLALTILTEAKEITGV